ncbi:hypothetical protein ANN_12236 [Periplaneta americana]|uniref:Uncharacterized protein n=1 Tax=Periplaneta americana TaxID=6978 RepID=A0ABQ8TFY5_PERAM|nr:hypothetical protein ANN_12236 [Periplaneta americana]
MTGLCEDGNEPSGSLKAICKQMSTDFVALVRTVPLRSRSGDVRNVFLPQLNRSEQKW